jgi:hypothetical protein
VGRAGYKSRRKEEIEGFLSINLYKTETMVTREVKQGIHVDKRVKPGEL